MIGARRAGAWARRETEEAVQSDANSRSGTEHPGSSGAWHITGVECMKEFGQDAMSGNTDAIQTTDRRVLSTYQTFRSCTKKKKKKQRER